jgi:ATP-dependent Clp protease, protease subunit
MFGSTRSFNVVPRVIESVPEGERSMDIWSLLLQKRIVFLGRITEESAKLLIAQMLYLESENENECIQMYINSSGGCTLAGLTIYDTMNHIKTPVQTLVTGQAASIATLLLCAGEPGERLASPNSKISLYPEISTGSEKSNIISAARSAAQWRKRMIGMISKHTGQPDDIVEKKMDRPCWLTPEDAVHFGVVDKVVAKREPSSVN